MNKEETLEKVKNATFNTFMRIAYDKYGKIRTDNLEEQEILRNVCKYLEHYDKNNEILNRYIFEHKGEYYGKKEK